MENFKYPIVRLFFDADEIACTFTEDMVRLYPELEKEFDRISWDISHAVLGTFIVLAVADAQKIIINRA